ncbi:MAG: PaaI family thioesterase [Acidimicrobiales bacterium]
MTLHRLDNSRWGFASNCFVCEASNPAGLRISFVHDDEAEVVTARLCLGDAFSGAPSYVHGGVVLAVMDEAMAWAAIAIAHTWALTRETTATFMRPVLVDQPHTVVARLEERGEDGTLALSAEVFRAASPESGGEAERCAEARATFVALSAGAARAAVGEAPGPDHGSYLRQRPDSPIPSP